MKNNTSKEFISQFLELCNKFKGELPSKVDLSSLEWEGYCGKGSLSAFFYNDLPALLLKFEKEHFSKDYQTYIDTQEFAEQLIKYNISDRWCNIVIPAVKYLIADNKQSLVFEQHNGSLYVEKKEGGFSLEDTARYPNKMINVKVDYSKDGNLWKISLHRGKKDKMLYSAHVCEFDTKSCIEYMGNDYTAEYFNSSVSYLSTANVDLKNIWKINYCIKVFQIILDHYETESKKSL